MESVEQALLARIQEQQDTIRYLVVQIGEHARGRGEAEGRLRISEMAGIVEGWRERATVAETRLAEARSQSGHLHGLDCVSHDPDRRGGRPCLIGTRVTIAQVLAELAETGGPSDVSDRLAIPEDSITALLNGLALRLNESVGLIEAGPDRTTVADLASALRRAVTWHEAASKAISKQPGADSRSWDRLQHDEQIVEINSALRAAGLPAEDVDES